MNRHRDRVREALKVVYKAFPESEIGKPDGSREKLSDIFNLANDGKTRPAISRQSKSFHQQLAFDFGTTSSNQKRGGI